MKNLFKKWFCSKTTETQPNVEPKATIIERNILKGFQVIDSNDNKYQFNAETEYGLSWVVDEHKISIRQIDSVDKSKWRVVGVFMEPYSIVNTVWEKNVKFEIFE